MVLLQCFWCYVLFVLLGVVGIVFVGCGVFGGVLGGDGDGGGDVIVMIYGMIVDFEVEFFQEFWKDWVDENGIIIKYEGSQDFEMQFGMCVQGGNLLDIVIFLQFGLFVDFVDWGFLKFVLEEVEKNVNEYWIEDWVNYGMVDDMFYGVFFMVNVKGWIWYLLVKFVEWGVEVLKIFDEMLVFMDKIQVVMGILVWCVGFEFGMVIGWLGIDWVEDYVLCQVGFDVYDQWVMNDVKFIDLQIKQVFDLVGEILLNLVNVNVGFGDVCLINLIVFGDVVFKFVGGECVLIYQVLFFLGFFFEGMKVVEDGDVWVFMFFGEFVDDFVVIGVGEIVGVFSDFEVMQKVFVYLLSFEWVNSCVSFGGVILVNNGFDLVNVKDLILQEIIKILQDLEMIFCFDVFDLMFGVVGVGIFWKGMVVWVNGSFMDEVFMQIEIGWLFS